MELPNSFHDDLLLQLLRNVRTLTLFGLAIIFFFSEIKKKLLIMRGANKLTFMYF